MRQWGVGEGTRLLLPVALGQDLDGVERLGSGYGLVLDLHQRPLLRLAIRRRRCGLPQQGAADAAAARGGLLLRRRPGGRGCRRIGGDEIHQRRARRVLPGGHGHGARGGASGRSPASRRLVCLVGLFGPGRTFGRGSEPREAAWIA